MQQNIIDGLYSLRSLLETAFYPETSCQNAGVYNKCSSIGQYVAVAVIVYDRFGGKFVNTTAPGQSHWFNRLNINGEVMDVDLIDDQFGLPAIRFGNPGNLWPNTRRINMNELHHETIQRAILLAMKAGLIDIYDRLQQFLESRK
ncbi:MAG: hypothetical protein QXU32_01965 [Nitrososphaerales archaeon]